MYHAYVDNRPPNIKIIGSDKIIEELGNFTGGVTGVKRV